MPIPDRYEPYWRSPVFTQDGIPANLRREHSTKADVWGLLHILAGRLLYRVIEPFSERVLEAGQPPGVIAPQVRHEVEPVGPVRFYLEFYHRPERLKGANRSGGSP